MMASNYKSNMESRFPGQVSSPVCIGSSNSIFSYHRGYHSSLGPGHTSSDREVFQTQLMKKLMNISLSNRHVFNKKWFKALFSFHISIFWWINHLLICFSNNLLWICWHYADFFQLFFKLLIDFTIVISKIFFNVI